MNVHTRAKTQKEVPRQTSTQTQSGAQIGAMLNRSDGVQASVSKAAVKAPAPPANQVNETAQTWLLTRLMPPSPHQSPNRKSTRLNSSHVAISYAVFCLKKKT